MNTLTKIFLNDKFVLILVILNAITIFLLEQFEHKIYELVLMDVFFTICFFIEMILKIHHFSFKKYISDSWNKLDFVLVLVATPSILLLFIDINLETLSVFLVFRILRLFKSFRIIKIFPDVDKLLRGFVRAIKQSYVIFLTFIIVIFIFSLFSCVMFKDIAPELFHSPLESFYSIFRLFTVEGWNEIPEIVTNNLSGDIFTVSLIRIYFVALLLIGGVIGLSLINSVFVDAMISDHSNEKDLEITELKDKVNELAQKIDVLINKTK